MHEVNWHNKVTFEIHELPELLSIRGHYVDFIDYPEGLTRSGLRAVMDFWGDTAEHYSRTYQGSRVRVFTPGRIFAHSFNRLFASLTFIPKLVSLLLRYKYDLIVLYSVPTNGWQTIIIAKLFRVPVVYRGLDVSHVIRRSAFRHLIKWAERYVYRSASWLSLNNRELLNYCVRTGADRDKTSVEFAGITEFQFIRGSGVDELRDRIGINRNKKIIYYLGTLFRFSGLDRLVEEFSMMNWGNEYSLVITGDGELNEVLAEQVLRGGLQNCVHLVGRIPFNEIADFMSIADIGVIPFRQNLATHAAFPWKAVQYLGAGLPVVASELRGLQSVFQEGDGISYVKSGDYYLPRIQKVLSDAKNVQALSSRGQQIVNREFSWVKNIQRFEDLFQSISAQR